MSNAKRVPVERLDFSIYKSSANQVAFSSTEERLPLWIKAMELRYKHCGSVFNNKISTQWEEHDDTDDDTKCDKVLINLTSHELEENLLSITIMVNKGRIQIQGKYMKEWGNDEFPILIELINNPDLLHSNPTKNLNNFIENYSQIPAPSKPHVNPQIQPPQSFML
jgi:hypothetical protein